MELSEQIDTLLSSPTALTNIVGRLPLRVEAMVGGNASPVYKLTLDNGENRVLKFADELHWLRVEMHFLERWAAEGIRTPAIIRAGSIELDAADSPGAYLLMECLKGENLFPLMEAGKLDNPAILHDLGGILAQMHTTTASGYGEICFSPQAAGEEIAGAWSTFSDSLQDQSWQTVIQANVDNSTCTENDFRIIEAAAARLDQQRNSYLSDHESKNRQSNFTQSRGSYVHNDFRAGNIIYLPNEPRQYAVIDPGGELNHPYLCLAYSLILEEIHGTNDPLNFQRGYASVTPLNEEALHAALFLKALTLLPRWGRDGQPYAAALHALFVREKRWLQENC